jgi:putative flippase GtrA
MTFLRYLAIQVIAYGVDMGTFLVALHYGAFEPIVANIVSKLAAGSFAFVVHRNFTFSATDAGSAGRQALRYFVLLAVYAPVSSAILELNMMWLPLSAIQTLNPAWLPQPVVIAKFISDIMCVALSFVLSKYFIFNKQPVLADAAVTGSES